MESPRPADAPPEREIRVRSNVEHREAAQREVAPRDVAPRFKMIPLHGEVLQGQLEN